MVGLFKADKAKKKDVPIIMLTARGEEQDELLALN